MRTGIAARTVIVPFETSVNVIGETNVVLRGDGPAPQDVDDALLDAVHLVR